MMIIGRFSALPFPRRLVIFVQAKTNLLPESSRFAGGPACKLQENDVAFTAIDLVEDMRNEAFSGFLL
ncbi:hypothetical protein [Thalassobacillus sp. C254]|uniref:hypothetical protein n=1 Tax=Thalassobacillus sp. C254 TaxID=1225341 RepID=UPI0012EE7807|nr:hypothetical protein [Thalassobacillus sp. C254]